LQAQQSVTDFLKAVLMVSVQQWRYLLTQSVTLKKCRQLFQSHQLFELNGFALKPYLSGRQKKELPKKIRGWVPK